MNQAMLRVIQDNLRLDGYVRHLDMLRMAMTFNQVTSAEEQILLARALWDSMSRGEQDEYVPGFPDQLALALEWALKERKTELVKLLVPVVSDLRGGIAYFVYGPFAGRALIEGGLISGKGKTESEAINFGSTLAMLYNFENDASVDMYLEPLTKMKEIMALNADRNPMYRANLRLRAIWSLVVQLVHDDEDLEAAQDMSTPFVCSRAEEERHWPASWNGSDNSSVPPIDCTQDRTLESMWQLVQARLDPDSFGNPADSQLLAYQELMIWAVLMNDAPLAEYFWQMGGNVIANALIVSRICEGLTHRAEMQLGKLADTVNAFKEMSDTFERSAIGVLTLCYAENMDMSQTVLTADLTAYDWLRTDGAYYDCLDLAFKANNADFVSHSACQAVIEREWNGDPAPGVHVVPETFPRNIWCYLKVPVRKFYANVLSYTAFVLLYSAVALQPISPEGLSTDETVLSIWVLLLAVEEIRQLLQLGLTWNAVKTWFGSVWNKLDVLMYLVFALTYVIRSLSVAEQNVFDAPKTDLLKITKALYGINILQVYGRSLQFFALSASLGPKIVIFLSLFRELMQFLALLAVFVISYGIYIQTNLHPFTEISSATFFRIWYRPYFQIYGELMLDELAEETTCLGSTMPFTDCGGLLHFEQVIPVITGIYLLITSIMLLNMLIAAFTNTYMEIEAESRTVFKMQSLELLRDYRHYTTFPAPFNAPIILWRAGKTISNAISARYGINCCGVEGDARVGLAEEETQLKAERFQDRLADEYLDRLSFEEKTSTDAQFVDVSAKLDNALFEIEYFKDHIKSASLSAEIRVTAVAGGPTVAPAAPGWLRRQSADGSNHATLLTTGRSRSKTNLARHLVHVVTRWKRTENGMRVLRGTQPLLEFVAIKRSTDDDKWALPDSKYESNDVEPMSPALNHAFVERNFRSEITKSQQKVLLDRISGLLSDNSKPQVTFLYEGCIIDDRDRSGPSLCRIETFHDDGNLFEAFELRSAGTGAAEVAWLTAHRNIDICGEQEELLRWIATSKRAYW